MKAIDPSSPIPLYHQIAQLIRARIQSGELAPGDVLEPLREAATEWEVNFHTVRHAYAELARDGLVEMRGPRGTHVLGAGRSPGAEKPRSKRPHPTHGPRTSSPDNQGDVESFLAETLRRARSDFGLTAPDLAELLATTSPQTPTPQIYVLECSEHQCQDLSRQIEASWDVEAVPWCLERDQDLPARDLVATHFHYNEIRLRWPERLAETRFVPIAPSPTLRSEIERRLGRRQKARRFTLTLCERDQPTADAVAADLSVVLPPSDFPLRTHVLEGAAKRADKAFADIDGDLLLLPPRIWGSLTDRQRNNDRLIEIRYLYDARELEAAAHRLGWTASTRRTSESLECPT